MSDAIRGIPATGAITNWIPLAFAFLNGLSMDYEVFILTRVREGYDETGSTSEAVVIGLGRTGRLVTSAALILSCAFAALAAGISARRDRRACPGGARAGDPVRPRQLVVAVQTSGGAGNRHVMMAT